MAVPSAYSALLAQYPPTNRFTANGTIADSGTAPLATTGTSGLAYTLGPWPGAEAVAPGVDYINSAAYVPNFTNGMMVAVWYNTTAATAGMWMIGGSATAVSATNYQGFFLVGGLLQFYQYQSSSVKIVIADTVATNDGRWHLAFAYFTPGVGWALQRDGVQVGTAVSSTNTTSSFIHVGQAWTIVGGVSGAQAGQAAVAEAVLWNNTVPVPGLGAQLYAAGQPTGGSGTPAFSSAANGIGDTWTYRFYQMQNGLGGFTSEVHLFDIPVNSVQFSTKLGQIGQLQGTVQTSDLVVQRETAGSLPWHLLCERTAVYVDLNGKLVWGGILQQAKYQRSYHQIQIIAQDWWGYFLNQRIISWNSSYTNADQLLVAADLMNIAQGAGSHDGSVPSGYVQGGAVGVTLGTVAAGALAGTVTSGVLVTASWAASAYKNVGQAISDLGTAANGFDWTIDVAYNGSGVPTKTFNLWYPRAGATQGGGSQTTFVLNGTSAMDYLWTTGQTTPGNVVFAAGSGSGNTAIGAEAAAPELLAAGWPVQEESVSFTDITDQSLLDTVALGYLNQIQLPVAQPEVYYAPGRNSDAPLGSYAIGDDARLVIDPDDYFPSGYDSGRAPVNWWYLNDSGPTAANEVAGGESGTGTNVTWEVTGPNGKLGVTPNVNGVISFPYQTALNLSSGDWSIATWIMQTSATAGNWLAMNASGQAGYVFQFSATGQPTISFGGSALTTTGWTDLLLSTWLPVVFTYSASSQTLNYYLGSVLSGTTTHAPPPVVNTPMTLLNQTATPARWMGALSDFRMYNHVMSQAEINAFDSNIPPEQWWRVVQWTMYVEDSGFSYNDIIFSTPVAVAGE